MCFVSQTLTFREHFFLSSAVDFCPTFLTFTLLAAPYVHCTQRQADSWPSGPGQQKKEISGKGSLLARAPSLHLFLGIDFTQCYWELFWKAVCSRCQ